MKPPATNAPHPTLRHIAEQAGVSAMTASRALGNRSGIAADTRERVMRIAATLGYRPDPEIAKLMHHIRSRHRLRFQSVICGLTTRPQDSREPYTLAMIAGARRRADELGHGFMMLHVALERTLWPGVHGVLRNRGVQGVLLLPQQQTVDLSELIDWTAFSVVAATASVAAPAVNRVIPDQFANALLLCRELTARGYRRIGFVTSAEHDTRVKHRFDAAVIWHGLREASAPVPPLVLPEPSGEILAAWFIRESPDVIVGPNNETVVWVARELRLRIPGRMAFASTSTVGTLVRGLSGIDERPEDIGSAAVDQLAAMITRRVCGLPERPTSLVVAGLWREGRTCRRRHAPKATLVRR